MEYIFRNIPKGIYAISIFHDRNNNGEIDKNFVGIPTEGYGFSNNIKHKFTSATFEEAQFSINKSKKITIKMEY
jgi:uncharacterized protein (DUF2141 family)